jgi:hypothetical protein
VHTLIVVGSCDVGETYSWLFALGLLVAPFNSWTVCSLMAEQNQTSGLLTRTGRT